MGVIFKIINCIQSTFPTVSMLVEEPNAIDTILKG